MKKRDKSKKLKMTRRAREVLRRLEKKKRVNIKELLKCPYCDAPYDNAVDPITGKVSKYLWKPTCEHNQNIMVCVG